MHPKVTIHIMTPDAPPQVVSFARARIHIGRVANHREGANDVVLAAPRISGRHAHILVDDEGLTLVDHSVNGTFVNGEPVAETRRLTADDQIEIDAFTLRCSLEPTTPRQRPRPTPSTPAPWSLAPEDEGVPNFSLFAAVTGDAAAAGDAQDGDSFEADGAEEPTTSLLSKHKPRSPASASASARALPPSMPVPPPLRREAPPPLRREAPPPLRREAPPPLRREAPPPLARGAEDEPQAEVRPSARAQLYRELALRHQAPAWGRPPPLDSSSLGRVLASVHELTLDATIAAPWPERIARELCERGPLGPLIDDAKVTRMIIRGFDAIDVFRGAETETASSTFSCPEALYAVIERMSGARLGALPIDVTRDDGLRILAWSARLSPAGPIVIIERWSSQARTLRDLVDQHVLAEDAATLLGRAIDAGLNVLIHGDQSADPRPLMAALIDALPSSSRRVIVRRGAAWPGDGAIILDGHDPEVWSCARRLGSEWLIVEALEPEDLRPFTALARHHGGGTIASIQARSPAAALRRMAVFQASRDGDLRGAERLIHESVDLLVGVQPAPGGRQRVHTINELRPPGELAELFTWEADSSSLVRTAVASQVLL